MLDSQRVFTDWSLSTFSDRIKESALKHNCHVQIILVKCVGPTKVPYTKRQAGMFKNGQLVGVAKANRRGVISWARIVPTDFEIEGKLR